MKIIKPDGIVRFKKFQKKYLSNSQYRHILKGQIYFLTKLNRII